ncbi:MAG: mevalonate kinase [Deltaproteobacteria bacterium]|nr:MAG: mevalonate kinase [Deltaproteobacteria bacterium]
MRASTGRGHGKLILAGEHAVVYGYPALATAIDRGVRVQLDPGPTTCPPALERVIASVLPEGGFTVSVTSTLPAGRGLGSSAALAVALVRAAAAARLEALSPHEEWQRVFSIEEHFHGTPSGIDQAVSARGGLIRYRRGPPPQITPLPSPDLRFVVLDSGTSGETSVMVRSVAAQHPSNEPTLRAIGELVPRAEAALTDPAKLGPLLTHNHHLLRRLGVSTPALDELVQLALDAGAYGAKLSGAGGGGVVLALVDEPDPVLRAAERAGVASFVCRPVPPDAEVP